MERISTSIPQCMEVMVKEKKSIGSLWKLHLHIRLTTLDFYSRIRSPSLYPAFLLLEPLFVPLPQVRSRDPRLPELGFNALAPSYRALSFSVIEQSIFAYLFSRIYEAIRSPRGIHIDIRDRYEPISHPRLANCLPETSPLKPPHFRHPLTVSPSFSWVIRRSISSSTLVVLCCASPSTTSQYRQHCTPRSAVRSQLRFEPQPETSTVSPGTPFA